MSLFQYENKKNTNYFEGWYLRLTSKDNINIALIFAVTKTKNDPHSFIQIFNGSTHKSTYYRFDVNEFHYDKETQTVHIGPNHLSQEDVFVHTDTDTVNATIINPIPLQPYNGHTSAMAWLKKAPLECYQDVIFMNAQASIAWNKQSFEGDAYMEKTYGTNFPTKWIWLQSNHSKNGSTISFSVGKIPFMFWRLTGFFLIYHIDGVEHRFTTYNRSKIKIERQTSKNAIITIKKKQTRIVIHATTNEPTELVGPRKKGLMTLPVMETVTGQATIQIYESNKLMFSDEYTHVGLELMY